MVDVPTSSLLTVPSLPPAYNIIDDDPPPAARLRRGPDPIAMDRTARGGGGVMSSARWGTSCTRRDPSQLVDARSEDDDDEYDEDDDWGRKRREVMPSLGGDGRGNGSGARCAMVGGRCGGWGEDDGNNKITVGGQTASPRSISTYRKYP